MTLEDRVSNLESNFDVVVGALEQVTQALRGISAKQDEHSAALQTIIATQGEQSQLLIEHSRLLGEHSEAIRSIVATQNEHSEALQAAIDRMNEHTRILLEHSVDLQFIKDMLDSSSDQEDAP